MQNQLLQIPIKLTSNESILPTYAHDTDIGLDLTAISIAYDEYGNVIYDTGLAIEIPIGYGGFIFPRSSISKYNLLLSNCVGVIDPGYTGNIICKMKLLDLKNLGLPNYNIGDRVAQLIILPTPKIQFYKVTELNTSVRGNGGFGSTGN